MNDQRDGTLRKLASCCTGVIMISLSFATGVPVTEPKTEQGSNWRTAAAFALFVSACVQPYANRGHKFLEREEGVLGREGERRSDRVRHVTIKRIRAAVVFRITTHC